MVDWSLYVFTARPDIFEENMHQKGASLHWFNSLFREVLITPDLFAHIFRSNSFFIDTIPQYLLILPFSCVDSPPTGSGCVLSRPGGGDGARFAEGAHCRHEAPAPPPGGGAYCSL